ncbi:hypothetical protein SCLCIDRAFT_33622 [Scleroderma citrinum Foug A]|uniref:Uncharacterized protein n=1 Tax=Scleroderma citrinum Foug A TaxID=1036808 RepID=A0A0C3D553_9AGAM|nr:hypothetical protein SCLCIDRAFT_33622 [Scleroderma citrinum Foug A]
MEPTSRLAHYSAIATDHDYTLLKGQPLSQLPDTSWYIPSLPAPPIPFVLGLSSGLRGLIWSSLCPLSPLPMALVSHAPAKSSFPSRS